LVLVAVLYQAIGVTLAWLVREIFFVPMDFRWGIIVVSLRFRQTAMTPG
jgi:hypothetical protein